MNAITSNQIALPYFAGITTHDMVLPVLVVLPWLSLSIGFGLLSYPVTVFSASSFVV